MGDFLRAIDIAGSDHIDYSIGKHQSNDRSPGEFIEATMRKKDMLCTNNFLYILLINLSDLQFLLSYRNYIIICLRDVLRVYKVRSADANKNGNASAPHLS